MKTFALRPRWLLGHVAVLVAVVVMVDLGLWQLRRLDERRATNARVEARGRAEPAPLDALAGRPLGHVEFRRASATGTFDAGHEVLVGYRTSDGLPGFHVVTPLVLGDGTAVLVNRGFVPAALADRWPVPDAAPPPGDVTVVGLVRRARDGRRPSVPERVRATSSTPRTNQVDVDAIAAVVPAPLRPFQLELQSPVPEGFPEALPPLDLGDGPHRSYALQWFGFALIAAVGWGLLVRRAAARAARAARATAPPRSGAPQAWCSRP